MKRTDIKVGDVLMYAHGRDWRTWGGQKAEVVAVGGYFVDPSDEQATGILVRLEISCSPAIFSRLKVVPPQTLHGPYEECQQIIEAERIAERAAEDAAREAVTEALRNLGLVGHPQAGGAFVTTESLLAWQRRNHRGKDGTDD